MSPAHRVLIVDDEPFVASALRRQLVRRGFVVRTCGSAAEALKLCMEPDVGVDILVTDFRMPGMNGGELLREIARVAPQIVRVLLSGYAEGESLEPERQPSHELLVRKPWNADELARDLLALAQSR